MNRLVALLVFAACARPAAPPLEVRVLLASSFESSPEAPERWWFDAPVAPVLVVSTASPDELELRWQKAPLSAKRRPVDGGRAQVMLELERPADGEGVLEVSDGVRTRSLRFVFRPSTVVVTERLARLATEHPEQVDAALRALPREDWPAGCMGAARRAEQDAKVDAYLACAEGAGQRGFPSERLARRVAAFFWARRLGHWARARTLMAELEVETTRFGDPRLRSQFGYQQGVFLADTGDPRLAETVLQRAITDAEEALQPHEAALARGYLAVVLSESGKHQAALELVRRLDGPPPAGLSRADQLVVRSNVTWVRLRAFAQDAPVEPTALHAALSALLADTRAAGNDLDASNIAANLAFLELLLGRLDDATRSAALARTLAAGTGTVESLFLDWLDGRLALRRNDGRAALAAFEAMQRHAEHATPGVSTDASWRAHLGRAEAALLSGKKADAATALAAARRALSSQGRHFAEPGERLVFFEDRRRAVADAVERFAAANACELAWQLADDGQAWLARSFESDRRFRLTALSPEARAKFGEEEERYARERERVLSDEAPHLASVEELEAWKVRHQEAMEQLRAKAGQLARLLDDAVGERAHRSFEARDLSSDEAVLEVFQTPVARRAFLVRSSRVSCLTSPEALEGRTLDGVAHLYVVEGGTRLWPSAALVKVLERATVSVLPSATWLHQERAARGAGALVVGDARFDLPHARSEAKAMAQLLEGELLLGDAATLSAVVSKWSGRAVFHFAGHGRLSRETPWEARLELARGQQLDFELLLSKRPTPWLAVLSGCDTGSSQRAPADGIGLAEGFLAGGSSAVLATTVELSDSGAGRFVERFYRHGGAEDPPAAFRLAVLEAVAQGDERWKDWKLFGGRTAPPEPVMEPARDLH